MLYKRCQGKEALFGALVEDAGYYILRVLLILAGTALYGILYAKRLSLPHISAFHMLKNIRFSLQGELEQQPDAVLTSAITKASRISFEIREAFG